MSFLIDTDVCSAYLKGHSLVVNRFIQYGGRLFISTISEGELFAWALRAKASPRRLTDLVGLVKDMTVLELDETVARRFGELRAVLLDARLQPPALDLFNAATALVHGLTMVIHNTKDYIHVPGLALADWLQP